MSECCFPTLVNCRGNCRGNLWMAQTLGINHNSRSF